MADQIIRLTEAEDFQSSFALFTKKVDASKGLSVTFDFYSYGGTGGDGFSFFFIDAAKGLPTQPGAFGGSLGYANRFDDPGISGGYLGVGFDEFGFYSNPTEGRRGGPGFVNDAIAVRGSEGNRYRYLVGTEQPLPFSLDVPGANVTREEAKRTALIQLTAEGLLSISIDSNNDGDFLDEGEEVINDFNAVAAGNGPVPDAFYFGFAGSTGVETNIHEVGGFRVTTIAGKTINGDFTRDLVILGTDKNDTLIGSINNDTIKGLKGDDVLTGNDGNDIMTGGPGFDRVSGDAGNDTLISLVGVDVMTGGTGGDTFAFSGSAKTALRASVLAGSGRDRITDFNQREGDRFQMDYDKKINTKGPGERPGTFYNVGTVRVKGFENALEAVYTDAIPSSRKANALKAGEAAIFRFKRKFFLTVNNSELGFSAKNDLVADLGKLARTDLAAGDFGSGKLEVTDYFL